MWRSQKKQSLGRKNFEPGVSRQTCYPHRLNFYIEPPRAEITLEDFELWAIDRVHVLGEIESCLFRNKSAKEIDIILKPIIDKCLPLSSNTSRNSSSQNHAISEQERKKDHYSHFILRLAFCRSEELRRRFVRSEKELFRIRFQNEEAKDRATFTCTLNFEWEIVSEEEKTALWDKLASATQKNIDSETYFKVDFERVSELVEKRRVFIRAGQAYVPMSEQSNLVITEYVNHLENALEITARALPRLDEDDRLVPILNHLSQGFTASEYKSSQSMVGEINASQIDSLIQHYPLCMRNLHLNLRKDKHLKHYGRLQYGLFLKGIGLSLEEALIFWRKSFSNCMEDRFTKEYRYNIRHSYGLEGNRRNYKPLSCQQILLGPQPGVGDCHGCPFRTFSTANLNLAISSLGISATKDLKDINDAVTAKHYHVACTRVFELLHPSLQGGLKESITHPNQYFDKSYSLIKTGEDVSIS